MDNERSAVIQIGGIDYEMEAGERTERGTTITLFIGADGEEIL